MKKEQIIMVYNILIKNHARFLIVLIIGSILVSILETVGISLVMLFISMVTSMQSITSGTKLFYLFTLSGCQTPRSFMILIGTGLIIFYLLRCMINIIHIYYLNKFIYYQQQRLATILFATYINLPFETFTQLDSSSISQYIFSYCGNLTQVLHGSMAIMCESFTIISIYVMLFYVDWGMTSVLSITIATTAYILMRLFSPKIAQAGKRSRESIHQAAGTYTSTFWNFKFLKLIADLSPAQQRFNNALQECSRAHTNNALWQSLPRFMLETIGFITLLCVITGALFFNYNINDIIPVISLYALAFYRFLPSMNKLIQGYHSIIFNIHAATPINQFMQHPQEQPMQSLCTFNKTIRLDQITFAYKNQQPTLIDASCSIKRGDRIGFVGESGSGKSTCIDIIMGLLKPTHGRLLIDEQEVNEHNVHSWRRTIGYIPQTIFLFNGSVADNIVCDRTYDEKKIITCLQRARIYDFLQTKQGIHTWVGENGITLSGGQKQRIAIARALYDNPAILILDEATSALDEEVEQAIMQEIYDYDRQTTIIIIAHRLSTLQQCDSIIRVQNGKLLTTTLPVKNPNYRQIQL